MKCDLGSGRSKQAAGSEKENQDFFDYYFVCFTSRA